MNETPAPTGEKIEKGINFKQHVGQTRAWMKKTMIAAGILLVALVAGVSALIGAAVISSKVNALEEPIIFASPGNANTSLSGLGFGDQVSVRTKLLVGNPPIRIDRKTRTVTTMIGGKQLIYVKGEWRPALGQ